jgi:hypothetical protein
MNLCRTPTLKESKMIKNYLKQNFNAESEIYIDEEGINILKINEVINQSEIKTWVTLKLIDYLTRNFP